MNDSIDAHDRVTQSASPPVRDFIAALRALEEHGDADRIAEMFTADAELLNLSHSERGTDGARRFWRAYRGQFGDIRSTFSRVVEAGPDAVLVWRSQGTMAQGHPLDYRGVSLLSLSGGKVARFETYYDSAAFLRGAVATSGG
jgi:ketosteroid isomerase-like protein